MAKIIQMLALSPTMEQGTIVKWRKNENDTVAPQDVLCEVETDKANMDYESADSGTLLKILVPQGQSARIGDAIAIIGSPGEDISSLVPPPAKQSQAVPLPSQAQQTSITPPQEQPASPRGPAQLRSSPAARRLGAQLGVDISKIKGTGPGGRIIEQDVIASSGPEKPAVSAAPQVPAAGITALKDETVGLNSIRKTIAARLSASKFSAPDYYVRTTVCADLLLSGREKLNEQRGQKISLNAFLIKLAAIAIARHPSINSSWNNDSIIRHGRIDIALAVATENGLLAPVIRDCLNKTISAIDSELVNLVAKARSGKLTPDDYENSTFTISNLGSLGIDEFTAIINPPNAAILAVGAIERKPHVRQDDQIVIRKEMKLTVVADHRIVDGATAARFAGELKNLIETPFDAVL